MKLKLTPFDLETQIPKYFLREREHELALRNKTMDDILKRIGVIEEEVPVERLTELEGELKETNKALKSSPFTSDFLLFSDSHYSNARESSSGEITSSVHEGNSLVEGEG